MATKAQDAVDRLWELTRHLSVGASGGEGSIFSIEKSKDGDQLLVTFNEEDGGRRYAFEVSSHRRVKLQGVVEAEEGVEGHQERDTVGQEQHGGGERGADCE